MPDQIIITPYDPHWPELFCELGSVLRNALGDAALRIDHIGSTSIPGLDAKPIIDVQISVAALEPTDPFRIPLENMSFVFRSTNPDRAKRYFRERPGERRTHIHVRQLGSFWQQIPLLFRDYMRTHPEDMRRYADLKYRIAERYRDDRRGYTEAKMPFIWEIMAKADKWGQEIGWQPGPSDA